MALATFNERSPYQGMSLDYDAGHFSLATGKDLSVPEIVRIDQSQGLEWADDTTRQWFYANQERFRDATTAPAVGGGTTAISEDQRTQLLAQAIQGQVVGGSRVESQGPFNAVLVRGKKINHLLQFFLTLLTVGWWGLVWIGLAIWGGEKRTMLTVDNYGNILVQNV